MEKNEKGEERRRTHPKGLVAPALESGRVQKKGTAGRGYSAEATLGMGTGKEIRANSPGAVST